MFYFVPTKLYEESNCVLNHASEWCALGTRALIVTGRSSAVKNGALADVREALEANGKGYVIFNEVEENPSIETIMKARDFGLSENVDFVVGIGGGSPLDASKAIALMIRNSECDSSMLYTKGVKLEHLPIAAIPTTCGTGSEVTPYAILTQHKLMTKSSIPHRMWPSYALVDEKYLAFAPMPVICNTAVDAFGHCVESYINANATDYSRMFADKGLAIWGKCKDALEGGEEMTPEIRRNLLNAAALGGMAISHTGTSLPHGLSYPVTYRMEMPHGAAIGYFQAGYLAISPKEDREHILALAGFESAEELKDFYNKVCHPDKVSDELMELTMKSVLANPGKLKNCPYPVDEKNMRYLCEF